MIPAGSTKCESVIVENTTNHFKYSSTAKIYSTIIIMVSLIE